MLRLVVLVVFIFGSPIVSANNYVTGQITSLLGSGADPAIRVGANLAPSACNGGAYGWLYFYGTPQERQWIYATALAMSVAGKVVTVYTNSDGARCEITNIQVTSGLN